ncbi:MAG: hypothetical protein AAFX40_09205 [Cyanobacteria bacterium J06639_1]
MGTLHLKAEVCEVVTKKRFVEFAIELKWTGADARRAYEASQLNLKSVDDDDEYSFTLALASFAGSELAKRQALQAAQKAAVTKKKNEIRKIKQDYVENIQKITQDLQHERSLLVSIISRVYGIAKQFGMQDPWVESLLANYHEFIREEVSETEADLEQYSRFLDEEMSEIESETISKEAS